MADLVGKICDIPRDIVATPAFDEKHPVVADVLKIVENVAGLVALCSTPYFAAVAVKTFGLAACVKAYVGTIVVGSGLYVPAVLLKDVISLEEFLNGATPEVKRLHTGERIVTDPATGIRTLIRNPHTRVVQQQCAPGEMVTSEGLKIAALCTRGDVEEYMQKRL